MPGISYAFVDLTIDDDEFHDDEHDEEALHARRTQDEYDNESFEVDLDDDEGDGEPIDIDADAGSTPVIVDPLTESLPPRIELERIDLPLGLLEIGNVVELSGNPDIPQIRERRTGDFFLVKKIFEVMESGNLTISGFRLRRCARLQPLFDGKLNDVVLTMDVERYNEQPFHVQGVEEIDANQIIGKRECNFTHLAYSECGLRSSRVCVPAEIQQRGSAVLFDYIFNNSPLYCRWVYVSVKEPGGKPYGGEARRLYQRECVEFAQLNRRPRHDDDDNDCVIVPGPRQANRVRSSSIEELDHDPNMRRPDIEAKPTKLTFADLFCCAGGASFGAVDAGYVVKFGVEIDDNVLQSYHLNHPGATAIQMDAHDFAAWATRRNFSVDHIHFSTTCKYFAVCHTVNGQNDQMNFETIYVVGPILKVLKPPYATAEQADGMIKLAKHRTAFRKFLNMILEAGYNVRYQVTDLANHGLPQRRRRLLFNMARIGHPLPPFPNPTHGPSASGLDRYVSVADALTELERMPRVHNDPLHQPQSLPHINMRPYNPHQCLLPSCITTSGGSNYHYSGTRRYTAREFSQLQAFPLHTHFHGSPTAAIAQIGNAYSPKPACQHFLKCAQMREAYEDGLVDAEEEIRDLWASLDARGVNIARDNTRYEYLNRLERNRARPGYIPLSVYARMGRIEDRRAPEEGPEPAVDRERMRRRQENLARLQDEDVIIMD